MTHSNGYGLNKPSAPNTNNMATPDPDRNFVDGQLSSDGSHQWNAMMQRWDLRYNPQAHSDYYMGHGTPSPEPRKSNGKRLALLIGIPVVVAAAALTYVGIANNSVKEPDCTGTSDASCVFDTLDAQGIEYNNVGTSGMDELGDALCTLDESGVSTTRMVKIATDNADMWTTTDATTVVDLVLATYCPTEN